MNPIAPGNSSTAEHAYETHLADRPEETAHDIKVADLLALYNHSSGNEYSYSAARVHPDIATPGGCGTNSVTPGNSSTA